ncbi:MAG: hypothetical protein KC550_02015, partial [Nanoarchaeota archaeon]|nr:hypothetical protein [Nanoarchaeota archaeon]
ERKLVEFMVKNKLIFFNWIILNFLAIIIVLAVFYINDNSLISIFISIILSSACIIILLFIYGLDSLEWNDDIWIWEPLHQVFLEMELLPYYPDFILKNLKGKKFLEKGTKIRVARYIPKTNYEEKEVEIITL